MDCFFLFFNMINSLSEHDCGTELLNVIKFIARFEKENMHMEHLRCVVERITYQSDAHVGSVLSLEGTWKVDSKYGRQLQVQKWEETLPATVYGIEKYLGSGLIKGFGSKFAKRIVQK